MGSVRNIVWLVLLLACCAVPLLVRYHRSGPARIMENLCVMSSQETWMRQSQGEDSAWLLPTWNGRPRVNKPPLLVWLNMASWADLEWSSSSVDELIARTRLVSIGMALLALLGTYLIAQNLSDHTTARLAVLVTGSSFLFIRQGRFATYDTHFLAWITLAVAVAIMSQRDLLQGRTKTYWFGCVMSGVLLGAALLTKGMLALLFVFCPVLLYAVVLCRARLRPALLGSALVGVVGMALFVAWYAYAFISQPHILDYVLREYRFPITAIRKPFWYYAAFPALVFPWTFWFLAALLAPLHQRFRVSGERLVTWFWLVGVMVVMSLVGSKAQRYLVPVLPPFGIMLAQFCVANHRVGRGMWTQVGMRWSTCLQAILLGGTCLLLPAIFLLQPMFGMNGRRPVAWFPHLPDVPMFVAVALLLVLLVIYGFVLRTMRRSAWVKSAYAMASLSLLASTVSYYAYSVSCDNGAYPHRADAERVCTFSSSKPLYYLSAVPDAGRIDPFALPKRDRDPDKEFLIYYRGIIPAITEVEVRQLIDAGIPFRLCARDVAELAGVADAMGLAYCFSFEDGGGPTWKLYESRRP